MVEDEYQGMGRTVPDTSHDLAFRVYSEGMTTNNKLYSESETHARVEIKGKHLRERQRTYYERVPAERIEEFQHSRILDENRDQRMVNNRFPELSAAREAFLGTEPSIAANRKRDASEVVKFSQVVEKLAQDEEPHPARLQFKMNESQANNMNKTQNRDKFRQSYTETKLRSMSNTVRQPFKSLGQSTLTHSMKHKYVVRSRHDTLGQDRFVPVNPTQAHDSVMRATIHDDGQPIKDTTLESSKLMTQTIHGQSVFKRTSPVSQDIFRASPQLTLDMGSTYSRFCPQENTRSQQNPRSAVLENFREISRIMTQNFITHKKIEKRYEKTQIPKPEMQRKQVEEDAAQRMTSILKMMHSPTNFSQPVKLLPFQKLKSGDGRDRMSMMAASTNAKTSVQHDTNGDSIDRQRTDKALSHNRNDSPMFEGHSPLPQKNLRTLQVKKQETQ